MANLEDIDMGTETRGYPLLSVTEYKYASSSYV